MLKSFFASREWALWAWGGLSFLLGSVYVQVELLVLLNEWYKGFYDLLQNAKDHDVEDLWQKLIEFSIIVLPYITIASISNFAARHYTFRWRQAMTFAYFPIWQKMDKEIEGASQRIQEDTFRFSRILEDLGMELFEAFLKLLAFLPILWVLSEHVIIPVVQDVPGSMALVALAVSFGGTIISWFVGIKLPGLEYNNQRVEAAYRKRLVYAEDNKSYATLPAILELFSGLRFNYFRLFLHKSYFDLWRIFFLQYSLLIPFIMMGPSLFSGAITLGIVIQTANAFDKVNEGFSYLIRSWTTITELMSIIKRLKEFEQNIGYRKRTGPSDADSVQIIS